MKTETVRGPECLKCGRELSPRTMVIGVSRKSGNDYAERMPLLEMFRYGNVFRGWKHADDAECLNVSGYDDMCDGEQVSPY